MKRICQKIHENLQSRVNGVSIYVALAGVGDNFSETKQVLDRMVDNGVVERTKIVGRHTDTPLETYRLTYTGSTMPVSSICRNCINKCCDD